MRAFRIFRLGLGRAAAPWSAQVRNAPRSAGSSIRQGSAALARLEPRAAVRDGQHGEESVATDHPARYSPLPHRCRPAPAVRHLLRRLHRHLRQFRRTRRSPPSTSVARSRATDMSHARDVWDASAGPGLQRCRRRPGRTPRRGPSLTAHTDQGRLIHPSSPGTPWNSSCSTSPVIRPTLVESRSLRAWRTGASP